MKLSDKKWTEFYIGGKNGVFNISSSCSGIDKNKLKITEDNLYIPYITRSEISNGINQFISEKQDGKYSIDKQNAITIGLDTQALFFQPYVFYTGQNIQVMRHNCLNKHTALFLILLLKIQMKKFNWGGNGATLGRLAKTRIMLPIDDNSKPDWQFMEEYTKAIFNKKQQDYKTYVEKSLLKIGDNIKMSAGGGVNGKSLF
ncbi:restriction endonuclease subunit S [Candidatus Thioglobus sp.]|uniref:restriction endonuclease subunit S n=1 Tax=Candidatus Thioglobus sp. TaxID=2026721 RepID=UPI003D0B0227